MTKISIKSDFLKCYFSKLIFTDLTTKVNIITPHFLNHLCSEEASVLGLIYSFTFLSRLSGDKGAYGMCLDWSAFLSRFLHDSTMR